MSYPAVPAFQSNALPVLPKSDLALKAAGTGRVFFQSRRGTRAIEADGAAVLTDLGRKLAPVLRAARADLAAAQVRS